ncbi:hypothetical protein GGR58DRAFT_503928 [Xylaria digitata]|nr:hypothetical protein GGR58DRAFT_503928 [Xylaria digitata]
MECRVWAASEWTIRCARPVFEEITLEKEKLDKNTVRLLRAGSLCENVLPLSLERWEYWRKRFAELAGDNNSLDLDCVVSQRSMDALRKPEKTIDIKLKSYSLQSSIVEAIKLVDILALLMTEFVFFFPRIEDITVVAIKVTKNVIQMSAKQNRPVAIAPH